MQQIQLIRMKKSDQYEVLIELEDLSTKDVDSQKKNPESTSENSSPKKKQQPLQLNKASKPVNNPPSPNKPNPYSSNPQNNKPNPAAQRQSQPQKQSIPSMPVKCKFCTFQMKVPGNSQLFVCSVCENMSQCEPKYNIFVCCCCHSKVCYLLYTSNYIKCSRCSTVNMVPLTARPPSKNIQSPNMQSPNIRPSYAQNQQYQNYQQPSHSNLSQNKPVPQQQQVWQNYQDFQKLQRQMNKNQERQTSEIVVQCKEDRLQDQGQILISNNYSNQKAELKNQNVQQEKLQQIVWQKEQEKDLPKSQQKQVEKEQETIVLNSNQSAKIDYPNFEL